MAHSLCHPLTNALFVSLSLPLVSLSVFLCRSSVFSSSQVTENLPVYCFVWGNNLPQYLPWWHPSNILSLSDLSDCCQNAIICPGICNIFGRHCKLFIRECCNYLVFATRWSVTWKSKNKGLMRWHISIKFCFLYLESGNQNLHNWLIPFCKLKNVVFAQQYFRNFC